MLGTEGSLLEVALNFQAVELAADAADGRILLDGAFDFGDRVAALHLAGDEFISVASLARFGAQPELGGDQLAKLRFL